MFHIPVGPDALAYGGGDGDDDDEGAPSDSLTRGDSEE